MSENFEMRDELNKLDYCNGCKVYTRQVEKIHQIKNSTYWKCTVCGYVSGVREMPELNSGEK